MTSSRASSRDSAPRPSQSLRGFAAQRTRLEVVATSPIEFEPFVGSTLRGGFGHALKDRVCTWAVGACDRCASRRSCIYPAVFEPAPPDDAAKLRKLTQIPRPFVIRPPVFDGGEWRGHGHRVQSGERFAVSLVLFGRYIALRDELLAAFDALGERGLGQTRGRFAIRAVESDPVVDHGAIVQAAERVVQHAVQSDALEVEFATPLRVKVGGRFIRDVGFQSLVRAVLRRLSSVMYFHCGIELDVDFRGLIDEAGDVRTAECSLRWADLERVSGRQHRRVDMGGVVGRASYRVPTALLDRVAPLIVGATHTHLGAGAVMGLGRIVLP